MQESCNKLTAEVYVHSIIILNKWAAGLEKMTHSKPEHILLPRYYKIVERSTCSESMRASHLKALCWKYLRWDWNWEWLAYKCTICWNHTKTISCSCNLLKNNDEMQEERRDRDWKDKGKINWILLNSKNSNKVTPASNSEKMTIPSTAPNNVKPFILISPHWLSNAKS